MIFSQINIVCMYIVFSNWVMVARRGGGGGKIKISTINYKQGSKILTEIEKDI